MNRLIVVLALGMSVTALAYSTQEEKTDRPGNDLKGIDLEEAKPELCRVACDGDAACKAYTYVNPGLHGPKARCYFKSAVPASSPNDCCVSGVKQALPAGLEDNTDRAGNDLKGVDLAEAKPELCRTACDGDAACKAYTYVRPGLQGPGARCFLKSAVPASSPNSCCVSGVKGATSPPPETKAPVCQGYQSDGKTKTWYWPNGNKSVVLTFDDAGYRTKSDLYMENGKLANVVIYSTANQGGRNCRWGSFPAHNKKYSCLLSDVSQYGANPTVFGSNTAWEKHGEQRDYAYDGKVWKWLARGFNNDNDYPNISVLSVQVYEANGTKVLNIYTVQGDGTFIDAMNAQGPRYLLTSPSGGMRVMHFVRDEPCPSK